MVFRARIVDGRADRGAIVHPSVKFVLSPRPSFSGQMTSEGEGMDEGDGTMEEVEARHHLVVVAANSD